MKPLLSKLTYLRVLFWLGPMLVVAGIVAGLVSGWNPLPLTLLIMGIVILGLWLFSLGRGGVTPGEKPGFWRSRATQTGANALIATLSVIAILGLINFLGVRYSTRLDLTENQLFTLAPESQQLVRDLKQPIKVWLFTPDQNPQDRELLERYRNAGKQFSFEFVDPDAQPGLARQFEIKSPGEVFLEIPGRQRRQYVQTVNQQTRLSEVKLTNALEQVTRDRPITLYFLQGHEERPLEPGEGAITQAVAALKNRNYAVQPLNLTANLPKDADVLVLAGPRKALLESERKALETYLKQGGNLLVLIDPFVDAGLNTVLKEWGITLDDRVAIDASRKIVELGPADTVVSNYGPHPITENFRNNFSFYSFARPIEVKTVNGVTATPLLLSAEQSWAESNIQEKPLRFDEKTDRLGPLTLGVALSRTANSTPPSSPSPQTSPSPSPPSSPSPKASPSPTAKPAAKESRLVVIGNSTFATDGWFDRLLNGDVFLNSVRWLSQQDQQTLSIRPREASNRRITLTAQQANLIVALSLGFLPLLGFGTAAIVWWRRR